jgi:hypothetical protein
VWGLVRIIEGSEVEDDPSADEEQEGLKRFPLSPVIIVFTVLTDFPLFLVVVLSLLGKCIFSSLLLLTEEREVLNIYKTQNIIINPRRIADTTIPLGCLIKNLTFDPMIPPC